MTTEEKYRERARAVWTELDQCSSAANELDIIAAALREVAEEAVKKKDRTLTASKNGFAALLAQHQKLMADLRAYESITPEDPEVKEAVSCLMDKGACLVTGAHSNSDCQKSKELVVEAYRAALVKIKEFEVQWISFQAWRTRALEAEARLAEAEKEFWAEKLRAESVQSKLDEVEAKLTLLTAPTCDEEEREALEWIDSLFSDGAWVANCKTVARSLRAKTVALREAEAKIAAEGKMVDLYHSRWAKAEEYLAALEKREADHRQGDKA